MVPNCSLYLPWGASRYSSNPQIPTSFRFTGQRNEALLGLQFFKARWYDPWLGRFLQPDTIVPDPGNPLDWDRYAYARNNALRYTDPTGHQVCDEWGNCFDKGQPVDEKRFFWFVRIITFGGGDPFHERVDFTEHELDLIALGVFSETNGIYPDELEDLLIWIFMNMTSASNIEGPYTQALAVLKASLISKGIPVVGSTQQEIAESLLALYETGVWVNPRFTRLLEKVKDDFYPNFWKGGYPDPTGGSTYFSMATNLTRDNDKFKNYHELHQWLSENFAWHHHRQSDFFYIISEPFPFRKTTEFAILVIGNDACVIDSSCGVYLR